MYFSAKNRINILLSAVPIRAWRLAYKERIGIRATIRAMGGETFPVSGFSRCFAQ